MIVLDYVLWYYNARYSQLLWNVDKHVPHYKVSSFKKAQQPS